MTHIEPIRINENDAEILGRFLLEKEPKNSNEIFDSQYEIFKELSRKTTGRNIKLLENDGAIQLVRVKESGAVKRFYYEITPVGLILFFKYYLENEKKSKVAIDCLDYFDLVKHVEKITKTNILNLKLRLTSVISNVVIESMTVPNGKALFARYDFAPRDGTHTISITKIFSYTYKDQEDEFYKSLSEIKEFVEFSTIHEFFNLKEFHKTQIDQLLQLQKQSKEKHDFSFGISNSKKELKKFEKICNTIQSDTMSRKFLEKMRDRFESVLKDYFRDVKTQPAKRRTAKNRRSN
ncbi:hypothetical protein AAA799E16_01406 [Marine Group I thaumarchaeote SCGC AAA799-E16]|uniref:Uncharacterized protein n=2 Tax=Marine Group I TaxID=905826 RepID=A0A087RXU5_9ARCH|nr:hypothetical protein AAA799E16_01406 [Marine Group I thaumarchaeote SCGC AAA799-E16]KFM18299.1 hypothetical protein SCCGRSA3_01218 [Marine Group I thaumarchaeote SCGC RSA3]